MADALSHSQAPTVLVVDDEDYVALMIADALEDIGYAVHVAYNGRDGLAYAQTLHPQLIIIDIMMPYLNGEVLADQLRNMDHTQTVPILMISAGARPRQQINNVVFLSKPFNIERLLELAERAIAQSTTQA